MESAPTEDVILEEAINKGRGQRRKVAGRIYAAPAALQNKSLLHHNRCRRLFCIYSNGFTALLVVCAVAEAIASGMAMAAV